MRRLRVITLAFAGVVGLTVGASSASAATFCVNSPPGCVGTTALTITVAAPAPGRA